MAGGWWLEADRTEICQRRCVGLPMEAPIRSGGELLIGSEQLVWRGTALLRQSEERAGSPLSSSLAPATEKEKKLLWSKGQRKMRAELGGGRFLFGLFWG